MKAPYSTDTVIAVLGGGQLGTMLATAAQPLRLNVHCLDPNAAAPASYNAQSFAEGEFTDRRTVEAFAKTADVATIEIEAVSTEGLRALRDDHGVACHPSPEAVETIQDKGLQKQLYTELNVPTAPYTFFEDEHAIREAVAAGKLELPFVQKLRRGGYDGKGVKLVLAKADLDRLLPGPSLTEQLAPIDVELAVVAARSVSGEVKTFPTVEMYFDPQENLVTKLFSPARVDSAVDAEAQRLAAKLAEAFDIVGLLAVEYFLLEDGTIWVNEVAPRPHNSGHVTMNGFATSQFEQHLRAITDMPLGSTEQYKPAVMVNVLGAPGQTGPAVYEGLDEILEMPGVHPHLYGKAVTKPARKMGHVNVVADSLEEASAIADRVRATLRATAKA